METKIAAFGESDIMLIFKAAGIEVFPVEAGAGGTAEIEKKLSELVKEGYGIEIRPSDKGICRKDDPFDSGHPWAGEKK
jgi:hypothetical protein